MAFTNYENGQPYIITLRGDSVGRALSTYHAGLSFEYLGGETNETPRVPRIAFGVDGNEVLVETGNFFCLGEYSLFAVIFRLDPSDAEGGIIIRLVKEVDGWQAQTMHRFASGDLDDWFTDHILRELLAP